MNVDDEDKPEESSTDDEPLLPPHHQPPPGLPPSQGRVRISAPFVDSDEMLGNLSGHPPHPPPSHGGPRDNHMPDPLVHTPPTPPPDREYKKARWDNTP